MMELITRECPIHKVTFEMRTGCPLCNDTIDDMILICSHVTSGERKQFYRKPDDDDKIHVESATCKECVESGDEEFLELVCRSCFGL